MRDLTDIRLRDLVPDSIRNDPKVSAAMDALDGEMRSVTEDITDALILPRIPELSGDILDHLAWRFNVDFYDQGYSLAKKRALVQQAIYWHRIKGTPAAVLKALSDLGYSAEITEWFDEALEIDRVPGTFRVEVNIDDIGIDDGVFNELLRVIQASKNARSHLRDFLARGSVWGKTHIGSAMVSGVSTTVMPFITVDEQVTGIWNLLSGEQSADTVNVYPQ